MTNQLGQVILFGGDGQNGRLNDSWAWDGTAWQPIILSARLYHRHIAKYHANGSMIANADQISSFRRKQRLHGRLNDTWLGHIFSVI